MPELGNIVFCKKSIDYYDGEHFDIEKGKFYLITDVYNYFKIHHYVQIYVERNRGYCNFTKEIFNEVFYTQKEIRRLKLDKLNAIQRK